jgi:predicted metallopeptidase
MDNSPQLGLDFGLELPPAAPAMSAPPDSVPPRARLERRARLETPLVLAAAPPKPFSYTDALWDVVRDLVAKVPELGYIDLDRVLLSITQARQASKHGVYASCVPLRFEGGARETTVRRHRFRMPEVRHQGREILYILYFMLPRFHVEQEYREKIATIIHELYHISPQFNGDIRRFPGKSFAHGHSRERYHAAMQALADRYLAHPDARDHAFLREDFAAMVKRPGGVVGFSITRPKASLIKP